MFVVCLFRALYQGTDKILDFTKSMVRMQKLLGSIDKLRTLVEGEWGGGGEVHQKAYRNLCHIVGQWVSGQNELTFHYFFRIKRVPQLALQELNFISQFNFSLVLPDIIANKALGESALPGNFFSILMHPTHLPRPLALMI